MSLKEHKSLVFSFISGAALGAGASYCIDTPEYFSNVQPPLLEKFAGAQFRLATTAFGAMCGVVGDYCFNRTGDTISPP